MRLILLVILTISCGKDDKSKVLPPFAPWNTHTSHPAPTPPPQDADLLAYMYYFDDLFQTNSAQTIAANFEETRTPENPNAVGWCFINALRRITINPEFWQQAPEFQREALMFHELGHCALNLPHDNRTVFDPEFGEVPVSIMNYMIIGNEAIYMKYRDSYLNILGGEDALRSVW